MGSCNQRNCLQTQRPYKYNTPIYQQKNKTNGTQKKQLSKERKYSYIENYQIIKELGNGYSCKVKLGRNIKDNKLYAIKIFKNYFYENLKEIITNEYLIQSQLSHVNINNCIEYKKDVIYTKQNGVKYTCDALILEYCESSDIFSYIKASGSFPEQVSRIYFSQIISALEYIHSKGICHRDIKPQNILFDENFDIKICDFGLSEQTKGKNNSGNLYTDCGTSLFKAPEISIKKKYKGQNADLFAAGVVLFIMVSGRPPFFKADPFKDEFYKQFINSKDMFWNYNTEQKVGQKYYSKEFKDLINQLLDLKPQNRLSIDQIKNHPWFKVPEKIDDSFKNRLIFLKEKIKKISYNPLKFDGNIQRQQTKKRDSNSYITRSFGN